LLNVGKVLLLAKQTQVHAENTWVRPRSDTKITRRKLRCCQWPLLAVCARPMPYCVQKLLMFME